MKVGLMGFGKTGRAVATVLLREQDFSLEWVIRQKELLDHRSVSEFLGENVSDPGLIYSSHLISIRELLDQHPVDIIIDFSSDTGWEYYAREAADRGIILISAVSHYPESTVETFRKLSEKTVVFWSPNITLGVNYLMIAAKFLKKIAPDIDMVILEEHFKAKEGISGTAKVMAQTLNLEPEEIKSVRAGGIIGKHEIICGFPFQTVRLVHESITREAFGNGVAFVARNLAGKKPGYYSFEELLLPYFRR